MGRLLLAGNDFTFAQPDPIAEFGLGPTVGLSLGVVATVCLSGLMSGLTLGLLSLDRLDLEVMLRTGTDREQQLAGRLAPIVKYPHWVLATLVIFNTVSSVALPLCMDRLVSSLVALVVSSTAIVLFGEILPQAVCSRHGLAIGGTMAPMVRALMILTAPLSWPIGWLLDYLLGHKGGIFGRRQLMALVDLHRTSSGMGGPLADDEFNVILGALDMTSKTAASNMTPLNKVFMLSTEDKLDKATLQLILESGHSRVPVYEGADRSHILGLIITKELLQYVGLLAGPQPPPRIGDIELRDVLRLPVNTRMYHLLDIFQTGQTHMALLTAPKSEATGAASAKWKQGRLQEDEEGDRQDEDKEGRARRKRWRDKGQKRFITLRSFGANSVPPGTEGSAHSSRDGSQTPRGASRGGGNESGEDADGGVGGLSTPKTPRSPKGVKDLSGLLLCLGSEVRDRGTDSDDEESKIGGGGSGAARPLNSGGKPNGARPNSERPRQQRGPHEQPDGKAERVPRSGPAAGGSGAVTFDLSRQSPSVASGASGGIVPPPRGGAGGRGGANRHGAEGLGHGSGGDEEEGEGDVIVGIITLEDVIEEMMGEEIVDETDAFVDNEKTTQVNARLLTMSLPPQLRRVLLSASLQHTAAAATAAALKQPPTPKLKAWTSTPQLKGAAASAPASGDSLAHQGSTEVQSRPSAGDQLAAVAAGQLPQQQQQQGWFASWRPSTPLKPARAGSGSEGGASSNAPSQQDHGAAVELRQLVVGAPGGATTAGGGTPAAAGGGDPAAAGGGTQRGGPSLESVNESPKQAAAAGSRARVAAPTRLGAALLEKQGLA